MKDLNLKQLSNLSNFMSDKEVEKAIAKALEEQQNSLNTEMFKEQPVVQQTLEDVLRDGGLFTYSFNGKKYKLNVLTKADMNILDNSSNYLEEGVEYDIVKPYKFHCKNSHDNYVTIQCKTYDEAQNLIDNIYSKGLYKISASVL